MQLTENSIDRLHATYDILTAYGSSHRRIGKTYLSYFTMCGMLDVLQNETILLLVSNESNLKNWITGFIPIVKKWGYDPKIEKVSRRIFFNDNSNNIKLITYQICAKLHPSEFGVDINTTIVHDLNNMPSVFYHFDMYIDNMNILMTKYNEKNNTNDISGYYHDHSDFMQSKTKWNEPKI